MTYSLPYTQTHTHHTHTHTYTPVDGTYEYYGKRTFVPMAITAAQLAVVLAIFLAMYKKLAPLVHTGDSREAADESEDEIELGPVGNGTVKYQPLSQEGPLQEEETE